MQTPLELSFRNLEPSPAVESKVQERLEKLRRRFDNITSCHVWIDESGRDRGKVKIFEVRIEVRVPGTELVVSKAPGDRNTHDDLHVALRDAFDAMERQLQDHARRQRGDVKTHPTPPQGKIVRVFPDRGYGFVATTDGREIYFHKNSVVEGRFDELKPGVPVELTIAHGESAAGPQASTLRVIGPMKLEQLPRGRGA